MSKYNQFNLNTILFILINVLCFGFFNIIVDPYGIMNSPEFNRVNKLKIAKEDHERLYKAIDVERIQPKTIFLGTSRVHRALDPQHPALANAQKAYNLAFPAATMYEQMRYLEYAISSQKDLKLVIIGISFGMFSSSNKTLPGFSEDRINKPETRLQELVSTNFSLDTFYSSAKTIFFNSNTNNLGSDDPNVDDELYQRQYLLETQHPAFTHFITNFFRTSSNQTQLSNEAFNNFKTIVNICKQRGIALKVFVPPPHATQTEAMRTAGLWPIYERWLREIVKITPVWDFSNYNSITTEPISEHMKNFYDSSHMYKEVGDLILNRILNYHEEAVPADFGVLVTPQNIESYLAKVSIQRQVWAENNPKDLKLVQNLYLKTNHVTLK